MASRLSFRVGSVAGIPLRVHLLLPAVVLLSLLTTPGWTRGEVVASLAVFFSVMVASILLHELGHALTARHHGLEAHEIEIWPLGGLTRSDAPTRPRTRVHVASAGVLVNLALAALAGVAAWMRDGRLPGLPTLTMGTDVLATAWNLNLALAILNLLPGIPFDGGAVVEGLLWARIGKPRARMAMVGTGAVIGVGLLIGGLGRSEVLLSALGVWSLFEVHRAYRELREGGAEDQRLLGTYDFSEGNRSLETSIREAEAAAAAGGKARRRSRSEEKARKTAEADRLVAEAEAAVSRDRLDTLLDRIAASGLDSLSPEERAFLEEESRRLRARRHNRSPA